VAGDGIFLAADSPAALGATHSQDPICGIPSDTRSMRGGYS